MNKLTLVCKNAKILNKIVNGIDVNGKLQNIYITILKLSETKKSLKTKNKYLSIKLINMQILILCPQCIIIS